VAADVTRYVALRAGVVAGGASFRIAEGVAQLTGALARAPSASWPERAALGPPRPADAAAAGCDIALATTQPASKSQQDAQRRGFDLLYTRAVLVKRAGART
jgi:hypothetical protein